MNLIAMMNMNLTNPNVQIAFCVNPLMQLAIANINVANPILA